MLAIYGVYFFLSFSLSLISFVLLIFDIRMSGKSGNCLVLTLLFLLTFSVLFYCFAEGIDHLDIIEHEL